jgi:CMP-N,N'-diacetyllegionaminic acid synthase
MTNIMGLITARGGSVGVPRKNIRDVAGKPLIAWSIQAARDSGVLSRVIVSTDDQEIADVSMKWGAEVPFMRPAELARDNSPHVPVILHAMDWIAVHESSCPEYIMLLQPTSPLRTSEDIRAATELAVERKAAAVVSVSETRAHPWFMKKMDAEGRIEDFTAKPEGYLRRQDFPPVYVVNGAIYITRWNVMREQQTFTPAGTYGYVMPAERSLDVDTDLDIQIADFLLRRRIALMVPGGSVSQAKGTNI